MRGSRFATLFSGPGALSPFIAQIGDSWLEQAHVSTASLKWQAAHGFPTWTIGLTGGGLEFPIGSNFSASGKTSAEILSEQVASAAAAAETVVFVGGPTNDHRGSNDVAAGTTIANIKAIHAGLPGKTIIQATAGPGGSAADSGEILSASQLANRLATNAGIRALEGGRIIVLDAYNALVDTGNTDGRAAPGMLKDGIHPTQTGFYLMVRDYLMPKLRGRVAPRLVLPVDTTGWLNSNPLMAGTTTATPGTTGSWTVTGNVPTGFVLLGSGGTGMTAACSVGNDADGDYCQVRVTGTPSSDAFIRLMQNVAGSGLTVGDVLQTVSRIKVAAGQTGFRGLGTGFEARDTGTVIEERGGSSGTGNGNFPDYAIDVVQQSPRMTLPSATYTGNNSRCYVRADFTNGVAADATFRVYKLGAKKVA